MEEGEALLACSDKSIKIGVSMWDTTTAQKILHIPSCASPPFGLLCLNNRFVVASQLTNKNASLGGGAIIIWPLNKPQKPLLNYTVEAIGPLSCTKDGIYLVGGALSGTAYLWDVTSGKLLKTWIAHYKSLNCMLFSDDNSILISGSDDGMICVWSMIRLLDVEEMESSLDVEETRNSPLLHCLLGHMSSITGLLTTPGCYLSFLVSSSLDGTCKVWDFISGRLMQTQVYPLAITCIALHQGEGWLFCGTVNGTVLVNKLAIGLEEGPSIVAIDQPLELKGHNGAITALTSSQAGLISTSEDCTICIWDVFNQVIVRRFDLQKGRVTNLAVVAWSSMLSTRRRVASSNEYSVSPLEKYPQPNSSKGTTTRISLCRNYEDKQTGIGLRSTCLLRQGMPSSQKAFTTTRAITMQMQMKVETDIQKRAKATKMAKHVMKINRQLKTLLTSLMQDRLFIPDPVGINSKKNGRKELAIQSSVQEEENQNP